MKSGILIATAAASLAVAAFAQTGVSGPPGIPSTLATTPDASASPTPAIPPPPSAAAPPMIPTRPRTTATKPTATPAAPAPASSGSAVRATPLAPAAPPPAPETPAAEKKGKRTGADFYTRYLTADDILDKAILDLTAEVKAHPDDPGLHNDLGNLLARRGFAKEAVEQYQMAAKLDHDFYLADYNEGLLWEKEGSPSSAVKAFERSIKRKPGFPLSRFHLGLLLEREGKTDAAIEQYAKALRIDPSLRWPARNPLVVQSRLLYRASIQNYPRDLAGATLSDDPDFANKAVWERLHPQRPVDTTDLESEASPEDVEPAPAVVGTGSPASAPLIGGKAASTPMKPDTRRQQLLERFRRNRPAPATPPQTVVAPAPAEIPAPPENENAPNPAMVQEQQQQPPPPQEEPPPPPQELSAR
ncbi:MAG TPA: tetratricopeptide repeat protein [Thermoanaerobaculia bacterium]|nr:tetratricopeptide repeat protein [Thermoanaerobaculia bacterium]